MGTINTKFPDLFKFSKHIGFSPEKLIQAFDVETKYHKLILNESDKNLRKQLYNNLYTEVHRIYYGDGLLNSNETIPFSRKAILFKKELKNKSILEIGCGRGSFIISAFNSYNLKKITGLDVSLPSDILINKYADIEFIKMDVIDFDLSYKYDIVYSNHVFEHMAPLDIDSHIVSLKNSLAPQGKLIINMPNKLFGPSDVTRIIDFSYTNKTTAIGSHFFESSYEEVINKLKSHGFNVFYSPIPNIYMRHLLPWFRINSEYIALLERNSFFIKLLHSFKVFGRCRANYEISIIASIK